MIRSKLILGLMLLNLLAKTVFTQNTTEYSVKINKLDSLPFDTNYFRKYPDKLIIGLYQSTRYYDIALTQTIPRKDTLVTALDFIGNANDVSGIDITYDKLSLSLAYKTTPKGTAQTGSTKYTSLSFSFGGNEWVLETAIRAYKGFYDKNNFIPGTIANKTNIHYQDPNLINTCLKAKFLYFVNHKKFSYQAAYSCSYRQCKTAASWVFVSNLFNNNLKTDSTFTPYFLKVENNVYDNLNQLNVAGFSAGAGASVNFVIFKTLFLNLTLLGGLEPQRRLYGFNNGENKRISYISVSGDFRSSIGFNGKRFYLMLSSMNDVSFINSIQLKVKNKFYSGTFTFGYRFKVKTPAFYERIKQTKFYKML